MLGVAAKSNGMWGWSELSRIAPDGLRNKLPASSPPEVTMTDEAEREHYSRHISRTFALLTAKLEDAAALAVDGQGPQTGVALLALAQQVAGLAAEAAIIAEALAVLLAPLPYRNVSGDVTDQEAGQALP
jgi:hypothetical protein